MFASLLNGDFEGKSFLLSVSTYDGIVRLHIDEPAIEPRRYQVKDVLTPEFERSSATWQTKQDAAGLTLTSGNITAQLVYKPFRLDVSVNGSPAVSINSRSMFNFEHRRTREVMPDHLHMTPPPPTLPPCVILSHAGWAPGTWASAWSHPPYPPPLRDPLACWPGAGHVGLCMIRPPLPSPPA